MQMNSTYNRKKSVRYPPTLRRFMIYSSDMEYNNELSRTENELLKCSGARMVDDVIAEKPMLQ